MSDHIADEEQQQQRAFASRTTAVLSLRCAKCQREIGSVSPSAEGLVLVALSHIRPSRSTIGLMKDLKSRQSPLTPRGTWGEVIVMLLREPFARVVYCRCGSTRGVNAGLLLDEISKGTNVLKV